MFSFFKSAKRTQPVKAAKGNSASGKTAAVKQTRAASPPQPVRPPSAGGGPAEAGDDPLELPDMPSLAMTPVRAQLIERALSVHRAQQKTVFADLDQKDRQKLMVMAMLTLLRRKAGNGGGQ